MSRRSKTPGAVRYAYLRLRILQFGMAGLPRSMQRNWRMMRILATPPWVDMKAIEVVYEAAHGKGHTVDHIIPLNHPRVCGLHVPWNLRSLPANSNFSRGNGWCEWHGDLFSEPEQLRLI